MTSLTSAPPLTKEEKDKFMWYIKNVDLKELVIPDEQANQGSKRKWYKFGAYDALRILSERVLSSES